MLLFNLTLILFDEINLCGVEQGNHAIDDTTYNILY